jgi:hypothetical protein
LNGFFDFLEIGGNFLGFHIKNNQRFFISEFLIVMMVMLLIVMGADMAVFSFLWHFRDACLKNEVTFKYDINY